MLILNFGRGHEVFPFVYMVKHLFITVTLGLAFVWITFRLELCLG